MDGQNFQNDNNVYGGSSASAEPVVEPAVSEPYVDNTYTTNTYQDSTSSYTDPVYSSDPYGTPTAETEAPKTPGVSIAALVLGICGIVFDCCCGVGVIFGIIGLILAIVGNKQQKSGVGTAALVCSIIALVFGVIYLVYVVAVGGMAALESM